MYIFICNILELKWDIEESTILKLNNELYYLSNRYNIVNCHLTWLAWLHSNVRVSCVLEKYSTGEEFPPSPRNPGCPRDSTHLAVRSCSLPGCGTKCFREKNQEFPTLQYYTCWLRHSSVHLELPALSASLSALPVCVYCYRTFCVHPLAVFICRRILLYQL
jgi:hypothetical protein